VQIKGQCIRFIGPEQAAEKLKNSAILTIDLGRLVAHYHGAEGETSGAIVDGGIIDAAAVVDEAGVVRQRKRPTPFHRLEFAPYGSQLDLRVVPAFRCCSKIARLVVDGALKRRGSILVVCQPRI